MDGLWNFLNKDVDQDSDSNEYLQVTGSFIVPGYWVALTAQCHAKQIKFNKLKFCYQRPAEYALAIGLENALDGSDSYPFERKNSGRTYSELVHLESSEDTDKATGTINSCIRELFCHQELSNFVGDLCDVVGDLHDNVWSHGMSTGFSMAQIWPKFNSNDYCFEFAVADCGLGFLSELRRVGLNIEDDAKAIDWCIQKGHSSKKLRPKDDWGQRLPADIAGNPMPGIGQPVVSDNHHMGLGLAKLLELVSNYKGCLWLASGKQMLIIGPDGNKSYNNNKQEWKGVVLACRFDTGKAKNYVAKKDDEVTTSLIDLLRA